VILILHIILIKSESFREALSWCGSSSWLVDGASFSGFVPLLLVGLPRHQRCRLRRRFASFLAYFFWNFLHHSSPVVPPSSSTPPVLRGAPDLPGTGFGSLGVTEQPKATHLLGLYLMALTVRDEQSLAIVVAVFFWWLELE
jgi:hypothetical protein